MTETQTYIVHVYAVATGRGDDPFTTIAVMGPFASTEDAGRELIAAGWVDRMRYNGEPMAWRALATRGLYADILILDRVIPASEKHDD